jgi:hypothetical protein
MYCTHSVAAHVCGGGVGAALILGPACSSGTISHQSIPPQAGIWTLGPAVAIG